MAGDWIKMRCDIGDDPAVIGIAEECAISIDETIGKLHRLWSWANRHTSDGHAPGIFEKWVDKYVGKGGFSAAMAKVQWLGFDSDGIFFPKFDCHNGESAKKRAENTIRQRLSRASRDAGETGDKRDVIPKPFLRHVYERDGFRCVFCGSQSNEETEGSRKARLSIDHLIPAARGGQSVVCNLVCACRLCNGEKNDRTPEEWGLLPTFLQNEITYEGGKICDKRATNARPEKRREEKSKDNSAAGAACAKTPSQEDFLEAWNSVPGFTKARSLKRTRLRHFQARTKDPDWVSNWRAALEAAAKKPFCCGSGNQGWVATVDWFLQPETLNKIFEGAYDDRKPQRNGSAIPGGSLGPASRVGVTEGQRLQVAAKTQHVGSAPAVQNNGYAPSGP